jgi:hypothetical protein
VSGERHLTRVQSASQRWLDAIGSEIKCDVTFIGRLRIGAEVGAAPRSTIRVIVRTEISDRYDTESR